VSLAELALARRTHKAFGPEPVAAETLLELLDVARFAPNHHLTQPWRFRVLGRETLAALKECAGPGEAAKLDRAPTLVVASAALGGETEPLRPGTAIHLPARLVHCLENTGPGEMHVLGVFRPAGSPAVAYYPDGTQAQY
jgi:nitroreductase